MTPAEYRHLTAEAHRHQHHLCDVWTEDTDGNVVAYGVIDQLRNGYALVSGHPQYGDAWVDVTSLHTACRITGES